MSKKKLIEVFKKHGFCVNEEDRQFFVSQCTPAGEDWGFYLDNLEDIKDYANNFDPDEEFEMWVEAKRNGCAGVPSYRELLEDQEWKQEVLQDLADEI